MDSVNSLEVIYNVLSSVYRGGAYSNIALNSALSGGKDIPSAFVTSTVYGVLDYDAECSYVISKLVKKPPGAVETILLKLGVYLVRRSDMPPFAAVNGVVELAKKLGKTGASGFINAVLKRAADVALPPAEGAYGFSINYGVPEWLCARLLKRYGADFTRSLLTADLPDGTHIRRNAAAIEKEAFEHILKQSGVLLPENTTSFGYYVTHNTMTELNAAGKKQNKTLFFPQALASAIACEVLAAAAESNVPNIMDACAAPGGKAINMAQRFPQGLVTACDIHPHRVTLIKEYTVSAGVGNVEALYADSTRFNPPLEGAFDLVLCDVPCSGLGVYRHKPDILLRRKPAEITEFAKTQRAILETNSKYVKKGGTLLYSTCTLTEEENEDVVRGFLAKGGFSVLPVQLKDLKPDNISPEGFITLYPHINQTDGFFLALLKRM